MFFVVVVVHCFDFITIVMQSLYVGQERNKLLDLLFAKMEEEATIKPTLI